MGRGPDRQKRKIKLQFNQSHYLVCQKPGCDHTTLRGKKYCQASHTPYYGVPDTNTSDYITRTTMGCYKYE